MSRLGVRMLKGMECGLDSVFSSCFPAMDCCEHDWNFATVRLVQHLSAVRTIFFVIVSVSISFFFQRHWYVHTAIAHLYSFVGFSLCSP
jgi:hypothetical protein